MRAKKLERPIRPSQAEKLGFRALAETSRKSALEAFFAFYGLKPRDVALSLGVHPSRVCQIMRQDTAPEMHVKALSDDVGVPDFLLPSPSSRGRAA